MASFSRANTPDLRVTCRVRTATLYARLAAMTAAGRLAKDGAGYRLADG